MAQAGFPSIDLRLKDGRRANVLVVPDLEAGNMLAKSLSFLAGADAAGVVLGARVPSSLGGDVNIMA